MASGGRVERYRNEALAVIREWESDPDAPRDVLDAARDVARLARLIRMSPHNSRNHELAKDAYDDFRSALRRYAKGNTP